MLFFCDECNTISDYQIIIVMLAIRRKKVNISDDQNQVYADLNPYTSY